MSSAVSITAASTVCCHGPTAPANRVPALDQVVQLGEVAGELGRPGLRGIRQLARAARRGRRAARVRVRVAEARPRVLQHGRPDRRGEIEPRAARPVQVDGGDDPEALRVALEPVRQPQPLAGPAGPAPARRGARTAGGPGRGRARRPRRRPGRSRRAGRAARPSASAVSRSAIARATCATCRLWVSRLCSSRPPPVGLTTCVTPARRAKNGEAAIRSRSTRNGLAARPTPLSPTPERRADRADGRTGWSSTW